MMAGNGRRGAHPPGLEPAAPHPDGAGLGQLLGEIIVPRLAAGEVEVLLSDTAPAEAEPAVSLRPNHHPIGKHSHNTFELGWVVDGQCVLRVGHVVVTLDPHRACVVRPGEPHQLYPTQQLCPFRMVWCRSAGRGVLLSQSQFTGQDRRVVDSVVSVDPPVGRVLERVVREVQARRPHYELIVRAVLLDFCGRILRGLADAAGQEREPDSRRQRVRGYVWRVMQYVDAHFEETTTLEQLASLVGLSPNYLTTIFRHHTGQSVVAYVGDVRHREALSLLRNTDLKIAEVGRRVGYADPYGFSRAFKARAGYTPLQYRRLFRGAAPPHQH
jgi:AraC-like DNA-binding protein